MFSFVLEAKYGLSYKLQPNILTADFEDIVISAFLAGGEDVKAVFEAAQTGCEESKLRRAFGRQG